VAFLLDARVRRATAGARTLDDVMRLAYQRYAGEKGFTADEFRRTTEEVAGVDLQRWFKQAVGSTEELDYTEALDWFGLHLTPGEAQKPWRLAVREDATEAQRSRLKAWLEPAGR
jgi:predicted metalloprotease with PDZ domain